MIRNYLKIAWRNLARNTTYSAINIGGLAVGMTVAMLIGLWIYDELSYNNSHENYGRIAQAFLPQPIWSNPTLLHDPTNAYFGA